MSLREMLSDYWYAFQQELFPRLEGELGPMGERYELFVAVLELVRVETLLPYFRGQVGCQSAFNIDPQSACKIDPLSDTAEVVPVANRGDPRGFV